MRGLTAPERLLLSGNHGDQFEPAHMAVLHVLVSAGRARTHHSMSWRGDGVRYVGFERTDMGALALRVCPLA